MNLIDCYVTKILGEPYRKYDSWGSNSKTQLMFRTEEAARAAQVGHHFLA